MSASLDIITDLDGSTIRIRPQVVDAGHHSLKWRTKKRRNPGFLSPEAHGGEPG